MTEVGGPRSITSQVIPLYNDFRPRSCQKSSAGECKSFMALLARAGKRFTRPASAKRGIKYATLFDYLESQAVRTLKESHLVRECAQQGGNVAGVGGCRGVVHPQAGGCHPPISNYRVFHG